jgi:AbrB family looped-hinge helix DNA binding protein
MARVSRRLQVTLPASVCRALGIRPGDVVEFRVVDDRAELRKVLPNPAEVVRQLLTEGTFDVLHEETRGDALQHQREMRWGDDQP